MHRMKRLIAGDGFIKVEKLQAPSADRRVKIIEQVEVNSAEAEMDRGGGYKSMAALRSYGAEGGAPGKTG